MVFGEWICTRSGDLALATGRLSTIRMVSAILRLRRGVLPESTRLLSMDFISIYLIQTEAG